MFFIDGTVNGNIANIILSVRVNNVDIYQAKKSEERIGSIIYTNHHLNLMVKLAQGDFVELVITTNTAGDNVSGVLFGYKL
jgi:ribosomal protein L23